MTAEKHIKKKERLNLALSGNLKNVSNRIEEILVKNNLDSTPEIAFDVFVYTLERMHLERFNHQKFEL